MPSKTSFFSPTLMKKQMTRFIPLWVGYALIWFLILPLPVLTEFTREQGGVYNSYLIDWFCMTGMVGGIAMAGAFSILSAMLVYGCFCSSRTAAAFGTLPVRREGLFLSCCTAGLLPMLVINLLIVVLASLFAWSKGGVPLSTPVEWFAVVSLLDIAFFGMATLAAGLTGNVFAMPVLYALIHFGPLGVEALLMIVLYSVSFGLSSANFPITKAITPLWSLIEHFDVIWYVDGVPRIVGIGCCAAWAAVGVVMMAAAMLLFKNRQLERASDVAATRLLRPIFRCIAAAAGIAVGYGIYILFFARDIFDVALPSSRLAVMLLFCCLGLACGWLCCEMLLQKTLRVFGKGSFGRIGVLSVVFVAMMLFVYVDPFGMQRVLPQEDDIAYVELYSHGWDGVLASPENIEATLALNRTIVDNKAVHRSGADRSHASVRFTYMLHDGSWVDKQYSLLDDSADRVHFYEMLNLPEAVESRCLPDKEVTPHSIHYSSINVYGYNMSGGEVGDHKELLDNEAYDLWTNGILPDIEQGYIGRLDHWTLYRQESEPSSQAVEIDPDKWRYDITVEFGFEVDETIPVTDGRESVTRSYTDWKYYEIDENCRNTMAWLRDNYPELLAPYES